MSDPGYLGAVLDDLLADERGLPAFTERLDGAPGLPYAARPKLEGVILARWSARSIGPRPAMRYHCPS